MDKAFLGLAMIWLFGQMLSFGMEGAQGVVTTTLTTDVGRTATSISVTSTTGFAESGTIVIREEIITYSGTTSTSFVGLTRGVDDTEPQGYDSGDIVYSEASGVINSLLDFRSIEFSGNIFNQVGTLFTAGGKIFIFIFRMLIWDFSWFSQSVMGVPMAFLQYFFYCISFGILIRLYLLLRGV